MSKYSGGCTVRKFDICFSFFAVALHRQFWFAHSTCHGQPQAQCCPHPVIMTIKPSISEFSGISRHIVNFVTDLPESWKVVHVYLAKGFKREILRGRGA